MPAFVDVDTASMVNRVPESILDSLLGFGPAFASSIRQFTSLHSIKDKTMLYWAAVFFIIALIAGVVGFGGIAAGAAGIAKILFLIFLVLFVISLIFGRRGTVS